MPAAQCRYDACVEVPESFVVQAPVAVRTLPGGEHAVTRFTGTGAEIGQAWMGFFSELLRDGVQTADAPYVERYGKDSSYNPATGVMSCELCIPIKG
ncbi:MAG: AraC family transcriptional regulator [Pseudomonas sp.]